MRRICFSSFSLIQGMALAGGLLLGHVAAADELLSSVVRLDASREGGRVDLNVRTEVSAPFEVIWAVLTDYENTAKWVPDMVSSKVIRRTPSGAVVEQSGHASVFFFRFSVSAVVNVQEHPPERVEVTLVRGDFKYLKGAYEVKKLAGEDLRYELRWHGQMELASPVPGFVAQPLLTHNVRQGFEGLVREIERRTKAGAG
jgi:ribosome-associated toxin RatA of RatAB toxin-antitoxin module